MRFTVWLIAAIVCALLASTGAQAQSAFVEGHVFNKKTGRPIAGALVQVFENVTAGPLPILLAEDVSDANGFYEVEVTEFLGFGANIEVLCRTKKGAISGQGSAILREDTIRRDIYLRAPRRLMGCIPPR